MVYKRFQVFRLKFYSYQRTLEIFHTKIKFTCDTILSYTAIVHSLHLRIICFLRKITSLKYESFTNYYLRTTITNYLYIYIIFCSMCKILHDKVVSFLLWTLNLSTPLYNVTILPTTKTIFTVHLHRRILKVNSQWRSTREDDRDRRRKRESKLDRSTRERKAIFAN